LTRVVFQDGRGDADGHPVALVVHDVRRGIDHRLPCLEGPPQGAGILADAGVEDIAAGRADGFQARNARNAFGGAVEGGNAPVQPHGKHPFVEGIENHIPLLSVLFLIHSYPLLYSCILPSRIGHYVAYCIIESKPFSRSPLCAPAPGGCRLAKRWHIHCFAGERLAICNLI
jgi:hypothetical protein